MLNIEREIALLHVAAGVILRDGQLLLSKRHKHAHQGGLWEFPGGKLEVSESTEQALARELREELGLVVRRAEPMMKVEHDYGDKKVLLDIWWVLDFDGEASGREGQLVQWCALANLAELSFPVANQCIVDELLRLKAAGEI
ncbi:MAG: 8-oxo-dGTP diphosphatase [Paracoccaceae bacterium]|jgi:8-oxo-dGTP diphosphatase